MKKMNFTFSWITNWKFFPGQYSSGKKQGFTLIELVLYISISVVLLLFVSFFLSMLLESKIKNQTISEVDQQGMQVLEIMTQTLRNATTINSPAVGSASTVSFSVDTPDPQKNPTVFDISNGILRIKEGSDAVVNLTSNKVTVSGNFENITRPTTNGMMRIQLTITSVNNSGKNHYNATKTFYNSVSLRSKS